MSISVPSVSVSLRPSGISHRLQVVSNFGDGACGAGEIHTRVREISRRRDTRPEGSAKIKDYRLSQGF